MLSQRSRLSRARLLPRCERGHLRLCHRLALSCRRHLSSQRSELFTLLRARALQRGSLSHAHGRRCFGLCRSRRHVAASVVQLPLHRRSLLRSTHSLLQP